MPQALIDATIDLRASLITEAEYGRCIARRAAYILRQKEGADRNGTTRWTCGAGTNAPIVRCGGKPASLPARVTRQPGEQAKPAGSERSSPGLAAVPAVIAGQRRQRAAVRAMNSTDPRVSAGASMLARSEAGECAARGWRP